MAIPGNVGNYNPSAKRGAFARSPVKPSAAKRGVFAQSPSAAKRGIFAFSPGGDKSSAPSPTSFAPSPRQAEDYSMKLLQQRRDQTRKDFFKGREDISPNRLDRRQIQADLYNQFKQTQMKPLANTGFVDPATGKLTGALYQSITPGGPTLADESMRLAQMYGPTPRELMGDIAYGAKSIMGGIAKLPGQMLEAYRELSPMSKIFQFVQGIVPGGSGTTAQGPMGLTPGQVNLYNNLIGNGMNPQMALEQAKRYVPEGPFPKSFAVGGIATLN